MHPQCGFIYEHDYEHHPAAYTLGSLFICVICYYGDIELFVPKSSIAENTFLIVKITLNFS